MLIIINGEVVLKRGVCKWFGCCFWAFVYLDFACQYASNNSLTGSMVFGVCICALRQLSFLLLVERLCNYTHRALHYDQTVTLGHSFIRRFVCYSCFWNLWSFNPFYAVLNSLWSCKCSALSIYRYFHMKSLNKRDCEREDYFGWLQKPSIISYKRNIWCTVKRERRFKLFLHVLFIGVIGACFPDIEQWGFFIYGNAAHTLL